jgi:hypothetical protein
MYKNNQNNLIQNVPMFLHYIGCRIINPQLYPLSITTAPVGTIQTFIILPEIK